MTMCLKEIFPFIKAFADAKAEDKVVGYVDILGFSSLVKNLKDPLDFAKIFPNIALLKSEAEHSGELRVFVFTDCIYLTADLQNLEAIFRFIAAYQMALFHSAPTGGNFGKEIDETFLPMLRGGIAYGKMFVLPENMADPALQNIGFVGKAMLDAEQYDDRYQEPAIAIDPSLILKIPHPSSCTCVVPVHRKCDQKEETLVIFDWKKFLEGKVRFDEARDVAIGRANHIIENALRHEPKEDIRQKYVFMRNYLRGAFL